MSNEDIVLEIQNNINVTDNLARLYEMNQGLMKVIIKPYLRCFDEEDLMQECYFALYDAVKAFDYQRNTRFSTYLVNHVHWSMVQYFANNRHMKKIPDYAYREIRKYHKYKNEFKEEHGYYPSTKEICDELNIDVDKIGTLERLISERECTSLDSTITDSDGEVLSVYNSLDSGVNVENQILDSVSNDELWNEVNKLDEEQRDIIIAHFKNNVPYSELEEKVNRNKLYRLLRAAYSVLKENDYVRAIAESYGFNSSDAYRGGVSSFKKSFTSSTEQAALRNIRIEEQLNKSQSLYDSIMSLVV
ncbi:hypothetical protein GCM10008910_45530 [Faecalicatena orotica]|uniref:RNA polymerase sigma factor (Sigma-70 family) n=1 Tax=Faecalicatena orotica TaxID=1544 RepID=A0A2Y9BE99_9FIRM|nr:sigma-70 family RNA polymerase sigma factor [Faecalicatena orotica]PWJ29503.1 RNA polymerase sigma factor (sigma-70 family) [Faecalicatena orotica]SSA55958.1 RNA polymerase sigma factor, sigma-70 family [Faecalicatena orotica]